MINKLWKVLRLNWDPYKLILPPIPGTYQLSSPYTVHHLISTRLPGFPSPHSFFLILWSEMSFEIWWHHTAKSVKPPHWEVLAIIIFEDSRLSRCHLVIKVKDGEVFIQQELQQKSDSSLYLILYANIFMQKNHRLSSASYCLMWLWWERGLGGLTLE